MMDPAEGDRIFVADLAAERSGLGEANVMPLRRACGHRLRMVACDESAVLLVAQTNGLRCKAAASDDRRCRSGRLRTAEGLALLLRVFGARVTNDLRYPRARPCSLDRFEPFPEAGFESFSIGGRQCVLCREVLVNPVGQPRLRI